MRDKRWTRPEDGRDEKHWEAVEEAGELLLEAQFHEALKELKRVIEADHQNPYAFNLLGTALFEIGSFEPARDAFKAALLVAPDFLAARISLSHVLRRLKDFTGAEREARIALNKFPKDGDAQHALGLALAARGKRRDARVNLQGFLDSKPEFEAETEVRGILEMLGLGAEDEPLDIEE